MHIVSGIKSKTLEQAPVGMPFIMQDPERDTGEKITAMVIFDQLSSKRIVINLETGHSVSRFDEDADINLCPEAVLVLDGQIG